MRVLFTAPRFHTNQYYSSKALVEAGYQVKYLVHNKGSTEDYSYITPELLNKSLFTLFIHKIIDLIYKKHDINNKKNKFFIPSFFKTYKEIKKYKPDVIICRDRTYSTAMITFIAKILKINKVYIYNQSPYEQENKKFKTIINSIFFPKIRITPVKNSYDSLCFKSDVVFVPFLVETQVVLSEKVYFKNNVVNILSIGKYQNNKNFLLLIKACEDFLRRGTCHLTIIGEVSDKFHQKYYEYLDEYINFQNLTSHITLIKNIPYNQINEYYFKNDVFVLPTKRESASISILEAMSNGLATISTSNNGTNCYINHMMTGLIFNSNDLKSLKNNLRYLINNRKTILKMGEKSYYDFKTRYSKEMYLATINNLFKQED